MASDTENLKNDDQAVEKSDAKPADASAAMLEEVHGNSAGKALVDSVKNELADAAKNGSGDVFRSPEPGGERTQSATIRRSLSELELSERADGMSKRIGERGDFGNQRQAEELQALMKDAAERGQLEKLLAKINENLSKQNSPLKINQETTQGQYPSLPELSPFTTYNHFRVTLDAGKEHIDVLSFVANEVHHSGMGYLRFPPRSTTGLPSLELK